MVVFQNYTMSNYQPSRANSYAGLFMADARDSGYYIEDAVFDSWIKYQKEQVNSFTRYDSDSYKENQAFALYSLAKAGKADLSGMNRLRSKKLEKNSQLILANAYYYAGYKELAKEIMDKLAYFYKRDTYGYATLFYKIMYLENLILLNNEDKLEILKVLKDISNDLKYCVNYLDFSFLLSVIFKLDYLKYQNKPLLLEYEYKGKNYKKIIKNLQEVFVFEKNKDDGFSIKLKNLGANSLFVNVVSSGIIKPENVEFLDQKLQSKVYFKTINGVSKDISTLKLGDDVVLYIDVYNNSGEYLNNLLADIKLPSGFQILRNLEIKSDNYDFKDNKDDRVVFYFSLDDKKKKTFAVGLNASYVGDFYFPALRVFDADDRGISSIIKGRTIKVNR